MPPRCILPLHDTWQLHIGCQQSDVSSEQSTALALTTLPRSPLPPLLPPPTPPPTLPSPPPSPRRCLRRRRLRRLHVHEAMKLNISPFGTPSSLMRSSPEPSAVISAPACSKYLRLASPSHAFLTALQYQCASRMRRSEAVKLSLSHFSMLASLSSHS